MDRFWHHGVVSLVPGRSIYFRMSNSGPGLRYPIRRGVLAAPVERDGVVVELGVFPFVFIAPEYRFDLGGTVPVARRPDARASRPLGRAGTDA